MQSYPTYPRSIQSELFDTALEKGRAQSQQMPGAFQPPAPSARAVGVRTRPQRVLGSFSSGLNADRLVIQLKPTDGKMTVPTAPCVLRYFCAPSRADNETTGRW